MKNFLLALTFATLVQACGKSDNEEPPTPTRVDSECKTKAAELATWMKAATNEGFGFTAPRGLKLIAVPKRLS